ncbi:MAG: hemerythrin domain-containing protein [Acidimicrobiaceae bacterium]|nr:hemerythrin domain-containing protein [Acidimicrobiaceae bacterium]
MTAMPTRNQVRAALNARGSYRDAARALGIPAGQAYLISTGLPADGGDTFSSEELDRHGALPTSTQHLVYTHSPPENPTAKPHVDEWMKARAAADQPMRTAAERRDGAPGEPNESGPADIATVLTRDHDRVTALLKQLKTIPGITKGGNAQRQARRKSIVDMITVVLSKHEAAEEEQLWPAVRSVLPDGDQIAETALGQEQAGKDVLTALGRLAPSEPEFDEQADELDDLARQHVAFEDQVLLTIEATLPEEERAELGRKVFTAEKHAPTRPHPHAPQRSAPAVKAAGAVGAAMDRLRDAATERPADRRGKA